MKNKIDIFVLNNSFSAYNGSFLVKLLYHVVVFIYWNYVNIRGVKK